MKTLVLAFAFGIAVLSSAAGQTVRGKIVNERNEDLLGAVVYLKGSKTGTITNVNGEFVLNSNCGNCTLIVEYYELPKKEIVFKRTENETFDLGTIVLEDKNKVARK